MFLHKDISQDKMLPEILPDITRRIDTERFGHFVFETGIVAADIDTYFTLFNTCRKSADAHRPAPNQPFVAFHLEGMRQTINTLHDRVNRLVGMLLYASNIRRVLDGKEINVRQYTILSQLLDRGRPVALEEMRRAPWYLSLYLKRNDKTRQRDLRRLRELELLFLDSDDTLWPGFIVPRRIKPPGKKAP